jgi:hypothetical protein
MTHNETFKELENLYIENRNNNNKKKADYYLSELYKLAKIVSHRYIRKYCERKGINHIDIQEKAHDASTYIIMQYLKKPNFRVIQISSYVYFGCLKALFQFKEQEMNECSYEEYFENNNFDLL